MQGFCGDVTAFANPDVYEYLEARRITYAIRLPANHILQDRICYLLKRPVGRPSHHVRRHYANFRYRAAMGRVAPRGGQGRVAS